MIVELFGPPGVGKTTFARALGARFEDAHIPARLLASERPAERDGGGGIVRRLARPVAGLIGALPDDGLAAALLALLPPREVMWKLRLRRYLVHMQHAWRNAAGRAEVVVCDQGFVQAVCSLLVLGQGGTSEVARALALLPPADLLVRLDAPTPVLAARLGERSRGQGRLERLLELDLARNLAFVPAIERVDDALTAQGRGSVRIGCADRTALADGAAQIAHAAAAAWRRQEMTAA
jgi:thymidylate kinase